MAGPWGRTDGSSRGSMGGGRILYIPRSGIAGCSGALGGVCVTTTRDVQGRLQGGSVGRFVGSPRSAGMLDSLPMGRRRIYPRLDSETVPCRGLTARRASRGKLRLKQSCAVLGVRDRRRLLGVVAYVARVPADGVAPRGMIIATCLGEVWDGRGQEACRVRRCTPYGPQG